MSGEKAKPLDKERVDEQPLSPEDIEKIQRHNRAAVRREFEELKKSRERSDQIHKDWMEL